MIEAYKKMWINGFKFKGRCRRKDYWLATILHSFIVGIMSIAIQSQSTVGPDGMSEISTGLGNILFAIFMIWGVASFIPHLSLMVRRLHDSAKSGLYVILFLIPCIGQIIIFVCLCLDGTRGVNRFGEDTKQRA